MFRRLMLFCLVLTGVFAATSMKAQQAPASAAAAAPTAPPQAGPRGGGRGAPPVRSPEVSDGRDVPPSGAEREGSRSHRCRQHAAHAEGRPGRLERHHRPRWRPNYYTYSIVVDGTTINDPNNRTGADELYRLPVDVGRAGRGAVAAGAQRRARKPLRAHRFHSGVANDGIETSSSTPPAGSTTCAGRRPTPCCTSFTASATMQSGGSMEAARTAIHGQPDRAGNKAVPMVVVTTLGYGVNNGPGRRLRPRRA